MDFIDLEKNGIIPRNDLLKSQLQVSKIQLAIDEATNNLNIVNFYLVNLLKLDTNTQIEIKESELPAKALAYIAATYPNKKIKETAKITDNKNVITYEAEVKIDGKGSDLIFDASGNFLKRK